MASQDNTYTVEVLRGSQFQVTELNRDQVNTVDQYRTHMGVSSAATVTIRSAGSNENVQRDGSYVLQPGDQIAAVESNKTGGKIQ